MAHRDKIAPPWPNAKPSDTDWARLAGFFSGEGCILTLIHSKGGYVTIHLTLSQKFEEPLLWVQSVFGGRIRQEHDQPSRYGRGPRYKWMVTSKAESVRLLRGMYPYLLTKKKQAALVIQLPKQPRSTQHAIHHRLKELKRTCA